jgi:hypothetical protein
MTTRTFATRFREAVRAQAERDHIPIYPFRCSVLPGRRVPAWPWSQRQKSAGTIAGTGMQVPPGGGDAGVPEGGLHQVNGRAAVEGMRSVGVAKPMGRNRECDASAGGRLARTIANTPAAYGLSGRAPEQPRMDPRAYWALTPGAQGNHGALP